MDNRRITAPLLQAFTDQLIQDEKSRATQEKYRRDLRHFAAFAAHRPLDKPLVLAYKATLEQTYAVTSANSMLAALNAFLKFAGWPDLCVRPFKVQRSPYCPEEKELTRADYTALVNAAQRRQDMRLSLVIQTLCATGIRVSELPFITVEAAQKSEAVVTCKGKTRRVFIVAALRSKLLRYARQRGIRTGSIFITRTGAPLDRSNIWRQMKWLCRQAGVSPDKVFPHNLRHLFARTFYRLEKDMAKLADILGHTNINTTRLYIITTGAEHKRRMESMRLII